MANNYMMTNNYIVYPILYAGLFSTSVQKKNKQDIGDVPLNNLR